MGDLSFRYADAAIGCGLILGTGIGIAGYFALSGFRTKKIASRLISQIKTNYHTESFSCDFLIDDEKINVKSVYSERQLFHSDIKKVHSSKDYFVLLYNGGIFLVVDKKGFTSGTPEQFLSLLGRK